MGFDDVMKQRGVMGAGETLSDVSQAEMFTDVVMR